MATTCAAARSRPTSDRPSLIVEKRVLCYVPADMSGWVSVDCFGEHHGEYVPTVLRWGPSWWLDHPESLSDEQPAIAAQLRIAESGDPSQA